MRFLTGRIVTLVGAVGAVASAAPAYAACGMDLGKIPTSWEGDAGGSFRLADLNINLNNNANIVGMWSVQFLVGSTMIDFGYSQWHSDGTEFLNSGGRAPSTQNYCLGVWQQTGPSRYRLNHWALSYDTSGTLNGRVNIREEVTVNPRSDTYAGPFTIDFYDPKTNAPLQHVAGQVVGKRITVNSGI